MELVGLAPRPHDVCLVDLGEDGGAITEIVMDLVRKGSKIPSVLFAPGERSVNDVGLIEGGIVGCIPRDELSPALLKYAIQAALAQARTNDQLRRSEARYRSLFEHNPHAVFGLDLEGRFLTGNRAASAVAGRAPGELIGASFLGLLHPDHVEGGGQCSGAPSPGNPSRTRSHSCTEMGL